MILGVSSLKFSVFHSQRDLHYGVDLLAFFADSCEGVFIVSPEFAERERESLLHFHSLARASPHACILRLRFFHHSDGFSWTYLEAPSPTFKLLLRPRILPRVFFLSSNPLSCMLLFVLLTILKLAEGAGPSPKNDFVCATCRVGRDGHKSHLLSYFKNCFK